MNVVRIVGLGVAVAMLALVAPAQAGQPVIVTPAVPSVLPNVLYDVDYAVSANVATGKATDAANTIISIGLPYRTTAGECKVEVAWFDWNGAVAGYSGVALLTAGVTLEFTSSANAANPAEYPPFTENVFRNKPGAFEGFARILSSCVIGTKLRVDAEFVTAHPNGTTSVFDYKPINVTSIAGAVGY